MEPAGPSEHVRAVSLTDETDRALWLRSVDGDDVAFREVYDRYAKRLLTYAYRRTASRPTAEDVVSVVMAEAWRRRRSVRFGEHDTMAGWLFRTAQYVLANESRAFRRHHQALDRIKSAAAGAAAAAGEAVDQHLLDDERLRGVLLELSRLPRRDREVLTLAAWSGLDEKDMAGALGIPVGTLKSRLSRARKRLAGLCAGTDRRVVREGHVTITTEAIR